MSAKTQVLLVGSEVFEIKNEAENMTELTLAYPEVTQWILTSNNGSLDLVNMNEVSLLVNLRNEDTFAPPRADTLGSLLVQVFSSSRVELLKQVPRMQACLLLREMLVAGLKQH